ncbi:carboxypeptidase-like regulatory domain-containing protein [Blastopirellula marina]|uniref:Carboxypeptidase regulatory-like domain-containing protein n=1 Tax=Blastopirellula marina TaxID=124 RepID=A0A2S8GAB2_9BACT|nr:carboxypeptidase-like regulatory domain-containing protein [Blastopirellula marina]PQO41024.1 hypothetical protein C5Y98_03410 [Blastopirellula marina]PTL45900.1 carboxypeptidase regulatory-like domain-containing protein [Blastopirellula marina]
MSVAACSKSTLLDGASKTIVSVTLDGEPVEGAAVVFSPIDSGRSATGITDVQGHVEMGTVMPGDGVLPGQYLVTVTKSIDDPKSKIEESEEAPTGRYYSIPQLYLVPKKYLDPKSSGLTATIEKGETNTVQLDLKN